jgi:hypothetical protein
MTLVKPLRFTGYPTMRGGGGGVNQQKTKNCWIHNHSLQRDFLPISKTIDQKQTMKK